MEFNKGKYPSYVNFYNVKDYPELTARSKNHQLGRTATYQIWNAMKNRCLNPKDQGFKNYGGRGIGISCEWMKYENFLKDMGTKPEGLEIDRINNNLGYSKDNCRWSTNNVNSANRRRGNKSKFPRGVSLSGNKYRAQITINYIQYSLKLHNTAELAHEAYKKIALEWYGFIPGGNNGYE